MTGYIYCVKNPLFSHLVKIGKTAKKSVDERGLNSSNVPEDFEVVFFTYVSDMDAVEKAIHRAVNHLRYRPTTTTRRSEFFLAAAETIARDIVSYFQILEPKDTTVNTVVNTASDVSTKDNTNTKPTVKEPDPMIVDESKEQVEDNKKKYIFEQVAEFSKNITDKDTLIDFNYVRENIVEDDMFRTGSDKMSGKFGFSRAAIHLMMHTLKEARKAGKYVYKNNTKYFSLEWFKTTKYYEKFKNLKWNRSKEFY